MERARKILWITFCGALILPPLAYLVRDPNAHTHLIPAGQFRPALAMSFFMTWLYLCSALLFLTSLDVFRDTLRRAYRLICLGLCLIGVLVIQIPLFVATGLFDTPWVTSGAHLLPYIAAWLLVYVGIRSFAKILGDTSGWTSVTFLAIAMLTTALSIWAIAEHIIDTEVTPTYLAITSANMIITFTAATIVLRIKKRAGPAYTNGLAWFVLALAMNALASLLSVLLGLADIDSAIVAGTPHVLIVILFVKAGYAFNKIREY